jgi:hypothetical protein
MDDAGSPLARDAPPGLAGDLQLSSPKEGNGMA